MIYNERIIKAINLAYNAHKYEKDKMGVPYIFHPFKVAESIIEEESQFGGIKDCKALEDCVIIALLHDVVETNIKSENEYIEFKDGIYFYKTNMSESEIIEKSIIGIRDVFGDIVADAVDALTRRKDEKYFEYIDRVCKNSYSVKVKIYDIKNNMSVYRMKMLDDKEKESLSKRYIKAMEKLVKFERL
ncbi:MAG: HD domain-containing protein [Bacilli bacterium]|nr:HD domain-containing protein [Bacilli bacterium]